MAATVDNKSDVSRQLGDDQENELLTAEEKEHSPTDPEKKEEVVEIEKDGSNLPEKTNHPLGTSCKLFPLHSWLYFLYITLAILLPCPPVPLLGGCRNPPAPPGIFQVGDAAPPSVSTMTSSQIHLWSSVLWMPLEY